MHFPVPVLAKRTSDACREPPASITTPETFVSFPKLPQIPPAKWTNENPSIPRQGPEVVPNILAESNHTSEEPVTRAHPVETDPHSSTSPPHQVNPCPEFRPITFWIKTLRPLLFELIVL